MICPCGVCEERFIGCHAECTEYKAWREAHDAEVAERYAERQKVAQVTDYNRENVERFKRRRK